MIECPECKGDGRLNAVAVACGPRGSTVERKPKCSFCFGTGKVTKHQMQWRSEGRRIRAERLESGLSLRERARLLNLGAVTLSDMEHGRIKPYTLADEP